MAATRAGKNSRLPSSSWRWWPGRNDGSRRAILDVELRNERKMVRHAPPDAPARDLDARRLQPARVDEIQLRQRQARGIGQGTFAQEVLEAELVHRRPQLAAPVVEVA